MGNIFYMGMILQLYERKKYKTVCAVFASNYKSNTPLTSAIMNHSISMKMYFKVHTSPRFLCRPTTLYIFARAVESQSAIYTENSGFASPTLGQHISTFRGCRILFSIRNPYINRFTNHFSIHS
jgi:hypothetical protein